MPLILFIDGSPLLRDIPDSGDGYSLFKVLLAVVWGANCYWGWCRGAKK